MLRPEDLQMMKDTPYEMKKMVELEERHRTVRNRVDGNFKHGIVFDNARLPDWTQNNASRRLAS
jgi:hypothetical protein